VPTTIGHCQGERAGIGVIRIIRGDEIGLRPWTLIGIWVGHIHRGRERRAGRLRIGGTAHATKGSGEERLAGKMVTSFVGAPGTTTTFVLVSARYAFPVVVLAVNVQVPEVVMTAPKTADAVAGLRD